MVDLTAATDDEVRAFVEKAEASFEERITKECVDGEGQPHARQASQARGLFTTRRIRDWRNRAAVWIAAESPEFAGAKPHTLAQCLTPFKLVLEKTKLALADSRPDFELECLRREPSAGQHSLSYRGQFKGLGSRGKAPRNGIGTMIYAINRTLKALRGCGVDVPADLVRPPGKPHNTMRLPFPANLTIKIATPNADQQSLFDMHRLALALDSTRTCQLSWLLTFDGYPAIVTPENRFAWLLDRQDSILARLERRQRETGSNPLAPLLVWYDAENNAHPYTVNKLWKDLAKITNHSPSQLMWRGAAELIARGASIFYVRQAMGLTSINSLRKLVKLERTILFLKKDGKFHEAPPLDLGAPAPGKRWCTVCRKQRSIYLHRCPDCRLIFRQPAGEPADQARWLLNSILDDIESGGLSRAALEKRYHDALEKVKT